MREIRTKDLNQPYIAEWIAKARNRLREIELVKSWHGFKILYSKLNYTLAQAIGPFESVGRFRPSIQVEPTNYCNVQRICCSTIRSTGIRGLMDFDLFNKIINDAVQRELKIVHPYRHGESMLHTKIIAVLNAKVNFADRFVFSILGGSENVHEAVMVRKPLFAMDAIGKFT